MDPKYSRSSGRLAAKGVKKRPVNFIPSSHTQKKRVTIHSISKSTNTTIPPASTPSIPHPVPEQSLNHLSVFNVSFADEISTQEGESNYADRSSEARVGDIVIYFPGVAWDFTTAAWATIVPITTSFDFDDDPEWSIFLSSHTTLLSAHHNIAVYCHDDKNVLQELTASELVSMERLVMVDGDMKRGTYYSPTDRMSDIFIRREEKLNHDLAVGGLLDPTSGDRVSLGMKASSVDEDKILGVNMSRILKQMKINLYQLDAIRRQKVAAKEESRLQEAEALVDIEATKVSVSSISNSVAHLTRLQEVEDAPKVVDAKNTVNANINSVNLSNQLQAAGAPDKSTVESGKIL